MKTENIGLGEQEAELHNLELKISVFLRWGVMASAAFLATGWISLWLKEGDTLANFREYHPEHLSMTLQRAWLASDIPILLVTSGLGILISLPICRVLLTAYLFIKQRDTYLALMAFFVFFVLLASFFLGIEI